MRCKIKHATRAVGDGYVQQSTATCEVCGRRWMEPKAEDAEQCLRDMCEALNEVEN